MKFSKKELHAGLKARSSKKRKRDDGGDEMVVKRAIEEVIEEQIKLAPL